MSDDIYQMNSSISIDIYFTDLCKCATVNKSALAQVIG